MAARYRPERQPGEFAVCDGCGRSVTWTEAATPGLTTAITCRCGRLACRRCHRGEHCVCCEPHTAKIRALKARLALRLAEREQRAGADRDRMDDAIAFIHEQLAYWRSPPTPIASSSVEPLSRKRA